MSRFILLSDVDPQQFPLVPGTEYKGFRYLAIAPFPTGLLDIGDGPQPTHTLLFAKEGRSYTVTNGQGIGTLVCLVDGVIDICPVELHPFAKGKFTPS